MSARLPPSGPVAAGSPVRDGGMATRVDEPGANLPITWTGQTVVRPGWTGMPQQAGGMMLGFAAPDEDHSTLRFIAVDSAGTVRWRADRPATCTGNALSIADGRPVAVLTDLRIDGGRMSTTASGHDLADGRRLWGPVPVPGSLQGPGLVFAAPAPAAAMGRTGPRVALDPATGRTVVDESEDPAIGIVGEYGGIVVTADDRALRGTDSATRKRLWQRDNPLGGAAAAPPGVSAPDGAALIGSGPGGAATLIDLTTGATLAFGVRDAAVDPLSGSYLALDDRGLTGLPPDGEPWRQDVPAGTRIASAGSGLVYLISGSVGRIYNALTGNPAGAYHPDVTSRFAVPQRITADGAAVFRIDGHVLLAVSATG